MPTVIDELIVTLGIDSSKFRGDASRTQDDISKTGREAVRHSKELEEALKKTQNETSKRLKQTEDVARQSQQHFTRFRLEVAALFTALATGFGYRQFIENVINSDAALGRQSKTLGVSVHDLAAWEEAVKRSGGAAGDAGTTLQSLKNDYLSFATGGASQALPILRLLTDETHKGGVAWSDMAGKMRPMKDILIDISEVVSHLSPEMRNFRLMQLPGMTPGMANLLAQGPNVVRRTLADVEKGGLPDEAASQRAIAFQNMIRDVTQRVEDLGRKIFLDLKPAIDEVIKGMQGWYDENKNWLSANLAEDLKEFVSAVHAIAVGINSVVEFMGGWRVATEVMFALWVGSKFLGVVASVTKLIGLMGTLATVSGGGLLGGAARGLGAGAAGAAGAAEAGAAGAAGLGLGGILLGLTAAIGLLYEGLHSSSASGSEEQDFERKHNEEYAREHPENVVPNQPSGVPYVPGALPKQMGITPGQYETYRTSVAGIEHARYDQMGGSSGRFAGRYQMGQEEIAETARQLGEPAPSRQQFLSDPGMQERFFETYTASHHATLMAESAQYRSLNKEQRLAALGYAHNQGVGGAKRWLESGQTGRDAFGTPGTAYSDSITRALSNPWIPTAGAARSPGIDPTVMRYGTQAGPLTQPRNDRASGATDNSVEAHINTINITTQATDATGIAKSIKQKLNEYAFVRQANRGLA